MGEHKHTLDERRQPTRALRERIPAVFDGYGQLSGAVFTDAALDAKTKELLRLSLVVLIFSPGLVAAAEDEPFHAGRCGLVHSWHHALVGVGCERVGVVAEANLTGNYT